MLVFIVNAFSGLPGETLMFFFPLFQVPFCPSLNTDQFNVPDNDLLLIDLILAMNVTGLLPETASEVIRHNLFSAIFPSTLKLINSS